MSELLRAAAECAREYLAQLPERRAFPAPEALDGLAGADDGYR